MGRGAVSLSICFVSSPGLDHLIRRVYIPKYPRRPWLIRMSLAWEPLQ